MFRRQQHGRRHVTGRNFNPTGRAAAVFAWVLALGQPATPALASGPADGPTSVLRNIFEAEPELNGNAFPSYFLELNGRSYFRATSAEHGTELWWTDGLSGTFLFHDICPGSCDSNALPLERIGDTLFFVADDGVHGDELWKTDGTANGTQRLTDTVSNKGFFLVPGVGATIPYGDLLLFTLYTSTEGYELWRSDGTSTGTYLVRDINPAFPGSFPTDFIEGGDGWIYFTAEDDTAGRELWRTDGTFQGTERVLDLLPGPKSGIWLDYFYYDDGRSLTLAPDGRILFASSDGISGRELWITDGTADGTVQVKDIYTGQRGSRPQSFRAFDGAVYFQAEDEEAGAELWETDGTVAGTRRVADIHPGPDGSSVQRLFANGDFLFFLADDGVSGAELWRLFEGQVEIVRDIWPGEEGSSPDLLTGLNGLVYFVANDEETGYEFWRTDGTETGTSQLTDLFSGPTFGFFGPGADSRPVATLNDSVLLFSGRDSYENGIEPWATDGTESGTRLLLDILHEKGGSHADQFTELDDELLFFADDGLTGKELWGTDGTELGTQFLADIRSGELASQGQQSTRLGERVVFTAFDDLTGTELWSSDGTAVGTELVFDIHPGEDASTPRDLTSLDEQVFFSADDGPAGRELWSSDGTSEETRLVKDLWTGENRSSNPSRLTTFKDQIFFRAQSGNDDLPDPEQLWQSDGTAEGTRLVRSAADGGPRKPERLQVAGSLLFFSAEDDQGDRELWRTDGTSEGTVRVRDLDPTGSGIAEQPSDELGTTTSLGARLLFAGKDESTGEELWSSDGSEAGTIQLADLSPGPESGAPRFLTTAGDRTYFVARDPQHGEELWITDGTEDGTRLILDLLPGPGASQPRNLTPYRHLLYFTATDGFHGVELWRSDGTADGTFLVEDIDPGELSSNPASLRVANDRLYFKAVDAEDGDEPRFLELQPTFSFDGTCQGPLTIELSGLTPGGRAVVFSSDRQGEATVPRGRCTGTPVALEDPTVLATPTADTSGRAQIVFETNADCGNLLQAIDRSTCFVGAVATVPKRR